VSTGLSIHVKRFDMDLILGVNAAGTPLTMEHSGWGWETLAPCRAWSYRLGPRAQWLGASRSRVVFNDRACSANATEDHICRCGG